MEEKIDFLSLLGGIRDISEDRKLCKFQKLNGEFTNLHKAIYIADPSYDQTFKRLFTGDNVIDNISGKGRIIAFLNAILFPDIKSDGYKIRSVEELSNEVTQFNEKTAVNSIRFDIACKCICWAEGHPKDTKALDIEMQTGYQTGFEARIFDYANILRINNWLPVIVLGFMNFPRIVNNKGDRSKWIGVFERDIKTGNAIKPLANTIDEHTIDLAQKAILLRDSRNEIIIGGKVLGKEGKEWLKLLSIRHWCDKIGSRYVLPDTSILDISPELSSALKILRSVNESELKLYVFADSEMDFQLNAALEEGKMLGESKMQEKIQQKDNEIKQKDEEIKQKDNEIQKKDNEIQKKDNEIEKFRRKYIKDGYKKFCKDNKMPFSKKLKRMQEEYDEDKNFGNRVKEFLFNKKTNEAISIAGSIQEEQIENFVDKIRNTRIDDCFDSDSETYE